MQPIAIVGAGGLGIEIKMLLNEINKFSITWNFIGFYDDNEKALASAGSRILGSIDAINELKEKTAVVIAVGNPITKQKIIQRIASSNVWFPTLIHPQTYIDNSNKIGEGSIITSGSRLTVNITLGKHVLINLNSTVGHDSTIGDFSSIMPGANISGMVQMSKKVLIGTGVSVINNVSVGENSIVGAGSVVTKDIPPNCTAVGIPAKPIEKT